MLGGAGVVRGGREGGMVGEMGSVVVYGEFFALSYCIVSGVMIRFLKW